MPIKATKRKGSFRQEKKPKPSFQPSSEFIDRLHRNFMLGYPDNNAFVMHQRSDPDEVAGRVEVIETERGQELFPGASLETPVLYTESPEDYSDNPEGKLFLGVGIGINEHKLPEEFQVDDCCATLTAKVLGIETDPTFVPIIQAAALDDLHASSAANSLAHFMKRWYRLRGSGVTHDVVNWSTARMIEWHQALKSGGDATLETANPATIQFCTNFINGLPDIHTNHRFDPILRAINFKKPPAADSLIQMAIRSESLGSNPATIREWFALLTQQWQEDLVNSSPEVLNPEMDRATKTIMLTVDGQEVPLVIIYSDKLENPKYAEYLAKFARWEKGRNAAVVIQRDANGNVQIFPNKKRHFVSLRGVAQKIIQEENDRWHFQYDVLLNGSLKHKRPPTALSIEQLVKLIKDYAWIDRAKR